jgi:two-component system, OmpR family, response regulator
VADDRVLIIESDEWESALLQRVLVEAGYGVEIAATAREGFARAQAWLPDCIVCDLALPDIDGLWVARMVRLDPHPLSSTPFLFLANDHDKDSRLQGFNVGADMFLTKPYGVEEVVAQVGALISMAHRMEMRESFGPMSSSLPPAMRGDVGQIDISTVLTLFEMERRTGFLKVRTVGGQTVSFELLEGMLERATLDGEPAEPTVLFRKVFGWKDGRFWFRAAPIQRGDKPASAIGPLLLEAMRLMDESAR